MEEVVVTTLGIYRRGPTLLLLGPWRIHYMVGRWTAEGSVAAGAGASRAGSTKRTWRMILQRSSEAEVVPTWAVNRKWKWKWKSLSRVWLFATPWTIQSMEFSRPNTGMGSLSLFQRIFPTKGLNPGLPCCRQIPYQLSHSAYSPCILLSYLPLIQLAEIIAKESKNFSLQISVSIPEPNMEEKIWSWNIIWICGSSIYTFTT